MACGCLYCYATANLTELTEANDVDVDLDDEDEDADGPSVPISISILQILLQTREEVFGLLFALFVYIGEGFLGQKDLVGGEGRGEERRGGWGK